MGSTKRHHQRGLLTVTSCGIGLIAAAALLSSCATPTRDHGSVPAGEAASSSSQPFQPSAPDCTGNSVRAEFRGGGYGGGNDFGGIWIWNSQAQPCTLRGRVAFAAYLPDGSLDPGAVTNGTVSVPPTTLPENMPPPPKNADPSSYMVTGVMGPERDDPSQPNGLCRSHDELTPATLALTLGTVSLHVRNHDADADSDVTAIYGCHGQVLLEDVTGPLNG